MESRPNPLFRLILPSLALGLFHWMLFVHPPGQSGAAPSGLSPEQTRKLREQSAEFLRAHRDADALNALLRLHHADPENHTYLSDLATTYGKLGRADEEVRYWEMFFERAPLPIEACPQIGLAYQKLSKADEAVHAFERCLALDSANSDSLFYLAHALERKGDYARAAELYKRGLVLAPNYADLRVGLARSELNLGQTQEARKVSVEVLQQFSDNVDALLVAGLASWRSGDRAAARGYLERGAKLAGNDADFRVALDNLAQDDHR